MTAQRNGQRRIYAPAKNPACGPGVCIHCGRWAKRYYGRRLCWPCRKLPGVPERYPVCSGKRQPNVATAPIGPPLELLEDRGPGLPRLPVLRTYPSCQSLLRCPHGLHDGECPDCERALRARLRIVEEANDD